MNYLVFTQQELTKYPVCLLVQTIRKEQIHKTYCESMLLNDQELVTLTVHQSKNSKKTPVKEIKQYIEEELQEAIDHCGSEYILCSDSDYFKVLTGAKKVEANLGYVLPSLFGSQKVLYIPSYGAMFFDPDRVPLKIEQALVALRDHRSGSYQEPGNEVIKFQAYPKTVTEIAEWLQKLLDMKKPLAIDIEAFSLKHHTAGIGTISFAWSKHEGIAFAVDYVPIIGATEAPFGLNQRNELIRALLKNFFKQLLERQIYHSISYDVYVLIYQLFMKDILDTEGLLEGLEVMLRNWDCTKIITYLATNSCAGNRLGLKDQSQEFCGNYAMGDDIHDITRIPLDKLLTYNLVDALGTHYVHEKHWDTLVNDQQLDIYNNIFKPAMVDIIQMQLTGMPVNMERSIEVNNKLTSELEQARQAILNNPIVESFTRDHLDRQHVEKRNAKLKVKKIKLGDEPQTFNPNSDDQMRALLFDYLELPVINLTDSKMPSTDGESIEGLLNHQQVTDPDMKAMLEAFQLHAIISVLTTNFMPSILGSVQGPDGWHYLFGNFNLGGTLSGRLSSSGPNLQNLPSTGKGHKLKLKYAKMIKSCFQAPPGWLFCGIDFASLEDRISALTTKDPQKLKVYTDGYDGHSLRAFAYFGGSMPDIDGNSVESINSIQKKYKPLRDRSKNPTFTLTYQGTYIALVKRYGFSVEQAKEVEAKYHELYKVSDDWVNAQLDTAMDTGYITAAFGLRLRTPLLKQVIRGNSKTPFQAEAEGRTAGNALGQSWCLLNSRAGIEFNGKVRVSEYRLDIKPCAQIHDAQYHLIRDDIAAIMFTNEHLVEAVKWQHHPDIWHDEVKLGGELSIFYPSWNDEIGIPNGATEEEIFAIIAENQGK